MIYQERQNNSISGYIIVKLWTQRKILKAARDFSTNGARASGCPEQRKERKAPNLSITSYSKIISK